MKRKSKKKFKTLSIITLLIIGIGVGSLVMTGNIIIPAKGDSITHTFYLQSLTGETSLCFVKTNLITSDEGGIDGDNPSQFIGGSGGVKPLDLLSADDLDLIITYIVQLKAWCTNPPAGGEIFVSAKSWYQLQLHWTNPDGTEKQFQTNILSQSKSIRVDDSEKVVKTFFIQASTLDPFFPEWSSTYSTTIAFELFGQMEFFEFINTDDGKFSRNYIIPFTGQTYQPIIVWDRITVDKVTKQPDPDFGDSIIFINSIKNAGTKLTTQNSLDTFEGRKILSITGTVTDWRDTQSPPRIEIFKCGSTGSCSELYVSGQQMRIQSGSSSTRQFVVSITMPQDSDNGIYKAKMSMFGRSTVDADFFNVLNINTKNDVCQDQGGTKICPIIATTISAKHLIFYRNDYQDFVEGLNVNPNIKTGYTDSSPLSSLQKAELVNPNESDDKKDRLDKIILNTVVRFDSPETVSQFKQVFTTDLTYDFNISISGSTYNIQGRPALIIRDPLTDCRDNLATCNSKNEIFLARATITSDEIERLLKEGDTGTITIKAKSAGVYQLITHDGILYDGIASGATYELIAQRGGGGGGGGNGETCQSSSPDIPCCEADEQLNLQDDGSYKCEPKSFPIFKTAEEECLEKGADYTWNTETEQCNYTPPPPKVKTMKELCESKGAGYTWDGEFCNYNKDEDPNKDNDEPCPEGTTQEILPGGGFTCIEIDTNKDLVCGENTLSDGTKVNFACDENNEDDPNIEGDPNKDSSGDTGNSVLIDCEGLKLSPVQCVNALQSGLLQIHADQLDEFNNYLIIGGALAILTGIGVLIYKKRKSF